MCVCFKPLNCILTIWHLVTTSQCTQQKSQIFGVILAQPNSHACVCISLSMCVYKSAHAVWHHLCEMALCAGRARPGDLGHVWYGRAHAQKIRRRAFLDLARQIFIRGIIQYHLSLPFLSIFNPFFPCRAKSSLWKVPIQP